MKLQSIEWDGRPIDKPGMYSKIGLPVYHSAKICVGPSVSSSGLRKIFSESPAHFYATWAGNPNCIVQEEVKKHFTVGRALHHLMLGEQFFSKLFAVSPPEYIDTKTGEAKKWTYAAAVCKAWREARLKEGREILAPADVESIKGMASALEDHPLVHQHKILNGQIERSLFWRDKETGLWVKSRPDAIPRESEDFVDLKKTRSVRWDNLQKTIVEYGYQQQGALIRTAAREVLGLKDATFTLVFVEDQPPHCVRIVTLKSNDLDRGERQNRMALDAMAHCLKSGHWPGPGGDREDAFTIELPEWAQKQIDDRLEYGISLS